MIKKIMATAKTKKTIKKIEDMTFEERRTACEEEVAKVMLKYGMRFNVGVQPILQIVQAEITSDKSNEENEQEKGE